MDTAHAPNEGRLPPDTASGPWSLSHRAQLPFAVLCWISATAPAWWSMAVDWWVDPNYSHGLLVPPVAVYLFWRARSRWLVLRPEVSRLGLAAFAVMGMMFLAGTAAAEHFTSRVAAVGGIGTLAWGLWGWRFVRVTWFPFVFLFFAIPWPYVIYFQLTFPLQLFSTKMACQVLDALGITLVRQGNIIHLPGYSLEVVEACSGVRSLLSLSTLGALFAYYTQTGIWRPWFLFALTLPIALGVNIFRLVVTAVGACVWDPIVAHDFLHELSGLLVFVMALLALHVCGTILTWTHRRVRSSSL